MTWIAITPGLLLVVLSLLPFWHSRRWMPSWIRTVVGLSALQCLLAVAMLLARAASLLTGGQALASPPLDSQLGLFGEFMPQWDATAVTMLALVSFIGWVVSRYSSRYLAGDPNQGRYFRWTALTVGAVCLMATAGSLLAFAICWALASLGVHHLLMHYSDRKPASAAAWTKFTFSRAGDICLIVALAALLGESASTRFASFGQIAGDLDISGMTSSVVAWSVILAACLKSAQFPFHSWLPQTIETPTPVSALMHAGIVNAGGYLLVRMNGFFAEHTAPLLLLAVIGATTAVVGGVIMSTQSSIKRSLAYSTVAQMGFMMLQCGLGAFSAAFVHIIAHSLYKAHAFLSSGNAVVDVPAPQAQQFVDRFPRLAAWLRPMPNIDGWKAALLSSLVTLTCLGFAVWIFQLDPASKPAGWLLCYVAFLAFMSGALRAARSGNRPAFAFTLLAIGLLSATYVGSYWIADKIVAPANPPTSLASSAVSWLIALAFLGLFLWQLNMQTSKRATGSLAELQSRLYVHAVNGFYVEAIWYRLLGFGRVRVQPSISSLEQI